MKARLPILVLVVFAVLFALGLAELFNLRLSSGDVYPPYSSLRSDPLGTMAFYESLQNIPTLSVRRDFSAENQLPDEPRTTYLHLAGAASEWDEMPESLVKEIERFALQGGRLSVTFFPAASRSFRFLPTEDDEEASPKSSRRKKRERDQKDFRKQAGLIRLKERWGLETTLVPLVQDDHGSYRPARVFNRSDLALPDALDWHSGLVFTNLSPGWHTLYARGSNAVVIERAFGSGTIAMATDSYFLSNEALSKERHADLLAWLVGPADQVVFDEGHFGILDRSGVAVLIRKYGLSGLVAGLLLLVALFIWKNSASFLPPMPAELAPNTVAGKDAAAGFINLLRRNIPTANLLRICFVEWKKSRAPTGGPAAARVAQAEAMLASDEAAPARDPVRTYHEICRQLKKP